MANQTNAASKAATPSATTSKVPAAVTPEETTGPQKYYLKAGFAHHVIVQGEHVRKDSEGDEVILEPAQFEAFRDKFYTAAQWGVVVAERKPEGDDGDEGDDLEAGE